MKQINWKSVRESLSSVLCTKVMKSETRKQESPAFIHLSNQSINLLPSLKNIVQKKYNRRFLKFRQQDAPNYYTGSIRRQDGLK